MQTFGQFSLLEKLIERVNSKDWWHVPPSDKSSYSKKGKFYSSTFKEAEFYGRPNDKPEKVLVHNPLVGDGETIGKTLGIPPQYAGMNYEEISSQDVLWKNAAMKMGYDSIIHMSPQGFSAYQLGKIPISIELNVF